MPEHDLMDKLVSLCKRRGFLFQSSEIYGGLQGFWDYGPLGVELKRNLKDAWWHDMVSGHNEPGGGFIGGLLAALPGSTAVLAANINSYRRFAKGSHAPTKITWGYDNRSAAIRVPDSDLQNTRIEHRVAGSDANPYLVLTVILGGILAGLDGKTDPGQPAEGNAYAARAETLPLTWEKALARFQKSDFIADCLGADYRKLYAACKRQEKKLFDRMISDVEYDAYLRDV